jgi:hypothetical protein
MKRFVLLFMLLVAMGAGNLFSQISAVSTKPLEIAISVQDYVNKSVQLHVEAWQKRGRYESSNDYVQRVTEEKRNAMVEKLMSEAINELKRKIDKTTNWSELRIADYDPDNQTFLIRSSQFGDFLLPVAHTDAETFEKAFYSAQKTNPDFYFTSDGKVKLNHLTFITASGKQYTYNSSDPARFAKVNVNVNLGDFNPDIEIKYADEKKPNVGQEQTISVGKSDIDVNIPIGQSGNDKTFAVIIANENYQSEAPVIFARNDGDTFRKYCVQTLGLPEKNVHFVENATLNNIRGEINWLTNVAQAYKGEANIIFYYAGHGIPDESSKAAYLLPVDGYGSDVGTGYKLDDLYTKLGALQVKNITLFMDACFSGAQRSGQMLASARGVAIKIKQDIPQGNMVVFSAAQSDETAYPYKEKGHGLFTYFLLKKLQETKGAVTLGELSSYVTTNVSQQSIVVNRKSQTPTVMPSASVGEGWKGMMLR